MKVIYSQLPRTIQILQEPNPKNLFSKDIESVSEVHRIPTCVITRSGGEDITFHTCSEHDTVYVKWPEQP